jgi:HK97 family phage major capsid protein
MNIKQLRQRAADLVRDMKAKQAEMGAADLTAEARTKLREEFKALEAQADANTEDLAAAERLAAREKALGSMPDADHQVAQRAERAAGVVSVKDRAEEDPKKGFKSHREFLTAVMAQGQGYKVDQRLIPLKQAAAGSDEQGVYSDPHGGFLVPEGFSPSVLQLQPEDDPFSGRTQNIPLASSTVNIPARVDKNHTTSVSGGLTVTRRPETVDATSSRMELEQVTMRAASLFGLSYATEEILTDSPISFIALISNGFSQEFASKLIDERINGSGSGEFEGVMNSPALISVSKETGQAADTINYENVKKMRARVWGYRNAIWLANHDCLPELMSLVQVVGTGGAPVYQPSAKEDRPDLLLGRPIFYTEYTKTIGDAGDILCVNPTQYLEGTYQPLQSAESMHVRFVQHERAFKFWLRNDGRGWWRSALTPKNSTSTLSPFVRLAARA